MEHQVKVIALLDAKQVGGQALGACVICVAILVAVLLGYSHFGSWTGVIGAAPLLIGLLGPPGRWIAVGLAFAVNLTFFGGRAIYDRTGAIVILTPLWGSLPLKDITDVGIVSRVYRGRKVELLRVAATNREAQVISVSSLKGDTPPSDVVRRIEQLVSS